MAIVSPASTDCAAARSMKFPPSEKPASLSGAPGKQNLDRAQRAHDIRQSAGVKQIPIEVMGFPVIAQVQPQDLEAPIEQLLRERKDIQRLRAALPAVQYDSRPAGAVERTRLETLQPHTVTTVEQQFSFEPDDTGRTSIDRSAARASTRQHRLHDAGYVASAAAEILRQVETARLETRRPSANPDLDAIVGAARAIPFAGREFG